MQGVLFGLAHKHLSAHIAANREDGSEPVKGSRQAEIPIIDNMPIWFKYITHRVWPGPYWYSVYTYTDNTITPSLTVRFCYVYLLGSLVSNLCLVETWESMVVIKRILSSVLGSANGLMAAFTPICKLN